MMVTGKGDREDNSSRMFQRDSYASAVYGECLGTSPCASQQCGGTAVSDIADHLSPEKTRSSV